MNELNISQLSEREKEVVDLAVDDDIALYEIIWRFNTIAPGRPRDELLRMAQSTARDLVRRGWIILGHQNYRKNEWKPVDPRISEELMEDVRSWSDPTRDDRIAIRATPRALDAYGVPREPDSRAP